MAYFHDLFFLLCTDKHLSVWETLPWREAWYEAQSPGQAAWHHGAPETWVMNGKARSPCEPNSSGCLCSLLNTLSHFPFKQSIEQIAVFVTNTALGGMASSFEP